MIDIATQNGANATASEAALLSWLGSRSIVLVGMMGVGKSSVGRRLAARLAVPFADADSEIEKAAGMSIADIFARHGEYRLPMELEGVPVFHRRLDTARCEGGRKNAPLQRDKK